MSLIYLAQISNDVHNILVESAKVSCPKWKESDVANVLTVFDFLNSRDVFSLENSKVESYLEIGIPEGLNQYFYPIEVKVDPNNPSHLNLLNVKASECSVDPLDYARSIRLIANGFRKDTLSLSHTSLKDLRLPKSLSETIAHSQYGDHYHYESAHPILPIPLTIKVVEDSFYFESMNYLKPRLAWRVAMDLVK